MHAICIHLIILQTTTVIIDKHKCTINLTPQQVAFYWAIGSNLVQPVFRILVASGCENAHSLQYYTGNYKAFCVFLFKSNPKAMENNI